jgi:hypothetical protein
MTISSRRLALGLTVVFTASACGADIPKPPDNPSRVRTLVMSMRNGNTDVKEDPKNKEALKTMAKWLAYSIAQPPYNGEPVPRESKINLPAEMQTMAFLMSEAEFFARLDATAGNAGRVTVPQLDYGAEMGAAIADEVKVVLTSSARPIERINAVRLLSIAAKLPAPGVVDPLLEIVNDAKVSDAMKLYAFQGLRNILDQTPVDDPGKHIKLAPDNTARLGQIGQALVNYIMQKRTPRDDKERDVIQFVRRDAVIALARFKDGVLRKPNKDLVFRPSWQLMRVMGGDPSAAPAFTIQEQAEAAIGFCQMKVDPDMNLDVAAYNVAPVVMNFVRIANLDGERAQRDKTLTALPWKVYSARLSYAIAVWRKEANTLPKARLTDYITSFAIQAISALDPIEKKGVPEAQPDTSGLARWMQDYPPVVWKETPPKPATLFKDDPQSLLPFAAPAKDTTLKTPDPKKAAEPGKTPDPKKSPEPKKGAPAPKKPG